MAVLLDEKYLIEQTDDNKDYIFKRIKEQIAKNKKKYPNWRERPHILREGLPKPFLYGNEIVQIKNVSAFGRGEKNIQLGRQTGAKKIREALLRAMTDKTGAAAKTAYGRGARKLFANQEDHHILFRTLIDNFYKNLPEDQAAELTAHLARRGSPVGNVIENLQGLDIDLHDSKMPGSLHQWARDMNIDSKSFPDLSNLDFDARTAALDDWLDLIEEPLLDRTATILSRQDYRRYGTKGLPKTLSGKDRPTSITKKDWLEFLYNQRENVKARSNLLDKYPILAEDLDSPNIRPELKAKYEKALSLVPEGDVQTFKALTKAQEIQAIDWVNDPDIRKTLGKPTAEVTELGARLGGIGDTITPQPHLLKNTIRNITKTKAFKIGAATTFGVTGVGFDALSTYAGTGQAIKEKDPLRKIAGGLEALSGVSGIASLTPAAPVAVPVSLLSGGVSVALNYAADLKDKGPLTEEERLKKLKQLQLSAL